MWLAGEWVGLTSLFLLQLVEAFTRSKSVVDARRGGQFSLLGGKISGEFVELNRPNRIVQRWREQSWPEGECRPPAACPTAVTRPPPPTRSLLHGDTQPAAGD